MIKVFKKSYSKWHEIKVINFETGEVTQYNQSLSMGFPFGKPYITNYKEMGYKSLNECIKELKKRNFLGSEIDYKHQKESEKIGYIKLGIQRIKECNRVNTTDFEDVIEKLKAYGLNYVDAQNQIIESYLQEIS